MNKEAGARWRPGGGATGAPLTLSTGGAFPALLADAGEGVAAADAGAPVGAGPGGAGAVLGWGRTC